MANRGLLFRNLHETSFVDVILWLLYVFSHWMLVFIQIKNIIFERFSLFLFSFFFGYILISIWLYFINFFLVVFNCFFLFLYFLALFSGNWFHFSTQLKTSDKFYLFFCGMPIQLYQTPSLSSSPSLDSAFHDCKIRSTGVCLLNRFHYVLIKFNSLILYIYWLSCWPYSTSFW